MIERKIASYFDIIDLIDRVMPPKSEFDYTQITSKDLIARFNKEIEESGFYFKEETLVSARKTIIYHQDRLSGRTSNFLGRNDGKERGFDQNNYFIQNEISEMKCELIRTIGNTQDLLHAGDTFYTRKFGSVEEMRPRMTRDKVEEYVKEVLTFTWEESDTIRPESYQLAADLLLHFGVSNENRFYGENPGSKIASMIENMEFGSRDFHGPRDSEGFYNSSTTNAKRHVGVLENAIFEITEYLYSILKDSLDKIQISEEKMEAERERKRRVEEKETLTPTTEPIPEEIPLEEVESLMTKFDTLEVLVAKNKELAKELAELRKRAAEIEAEIAKNTEEIKNSLK